MPASSSVGSELSATEIRYRLEYAVYFALTRCIRLLPHRLVGRLGAVVGWLTFSLPGRRRRVILENLSQSFADQSEKENRKTGRACLAHWGRIFFESISLARYDEETMKGFFDVQGLENLEAANQEGRGLIVSTGHFGAFEIAAYGVRHYVGRVNILVRPQSNPWVDQDNVRWRERSGNRLVPRRKAGHRMLNLLRSGESVAFAMDQRVRPTEGVLIPFLGRPAWTGTVPAMLSTLSGAPVVPFTSLSLPGGRYLIEFGPAIHPDGRGEQAIFQLTRRYTQLIEDAIQAHPEQWFWMHSRWLRSPRHRWASSIERLREDSALPEKPPATPLERSPRPLGEEEIEVGRSLVLAGGSPESQRHALVMIGHDLIDRGHPVLFSDAGELSRALRSSSLSAEVEHRRLDRYNVVVLEAFDLLELEDEARIQQLIEHRRERRTLLIGRRPDPDEEPTLFRLEADASPDQPEAAST